MGHPTMMSQGCGTAWTGKTGVWVEASGPVPPGVTVGSGANASKHYSDANAIGPLLTVMGPADTEQRGYWVVVPTGYDPTKAYPVIYQGAGCDDPNLYDSGESVYSFQTYDSAGAIQVGLDYDTYSTVAECFDNREAKSNDFGFMPMLMAQIEKDFCVDINHEYFVGYSSGAWVAQQFNCAFSDKLRGTMATTGCEPGDPASQPNTNDGQPTCVNHPSATMYIHDKDDTDNTYQCILSGCTRMLKQNGCTATSCQELATNPTPADTTPYTPPAKATVPSGTQCVSFNGCPADYPVVFCTTHLPTGPNSNDHSSQDAFAIPLYWDLIQKEFSSQN
jgi:poly(3-hydroxybutyrate) depolymerase